jgi:3-vinyl bacteriochlorophyllide hydratase
MTVQGDAMQADGVRRKSARDGTRRPALYTPAERARRDGSVWTLVQGILAPVQFVIFAISLVLVVRYLATGQGLALATASVVIKTAALYTIMVTGAIWEKVVFGRYLFAPAFYWEDMFSMVVIALHTAYVAALLGDIGSDRTRLFVALAGYAAYVVNATQFILKLRAARLDTAGLVPA